MYILPYSYVESRSIRIERTRTDRGDTRYLKRGPC